MTGAARLVRARDARRRDVLRLGRRLRQGARDDVAQKDPVSPHPLASPPPRVRRRRRQDRPVLGRRVARRQHEVGHRSACGPVPAAGMEKGTDLPSPFVRSFEPLRGVTAPVSNSPNTSHPPR